MFEDSLVESQGRIRTQSKWFAIGSFFAQSAILLMLLLFPLLHPQALPKHSLAQLLIAPPPPRAPAPVEIRRAVSSASGHQALPSLQEQLQVPGRIPTNISMIADPGPPATSSFAASEGGGIDLGSSPPVVTVAKPAAPKGPVKISSGVATGQLISPIQPRYPEIAKQARIQGTVTLEATISRGGTIANLRVTDGPPMLRQAAMDAVAAARYRPFLLNGEPVEVQTSIRVIFSLGG